MSVEGQQHVVQARGAASQSPVCRSLATCNRPRSIWSWRAAAASACGCVELVVRLAAGGVGHDVGSDLHRMQHQQAERGRPLGHRLQRPLVPQAGVIAGRIDERRPAAEVDPQQLGPFRVERKFGAIDRMLRRQTFELRFARDRVRETRLRDSLVEAGAVAVVDGEDEAPLLDVGPQQLHLGLGELGLVEAADVEDRRLQQIADAAVGDDLVQVDFLIGEQLGPLRQAADVIGEIAGVVGVQVPIGQRVIVRLPLLRAVIQLVDQDRGEALRQKQQGEARGDDRIGFDCRERRVPASIVPRLPFEQDSWPLRGTSRGCQRIAAPKDGRRARRRRGSTAPSSRPCPGLTPTAKYRSKPLRRRGGAPRLARGA